MARPIDIREHKELIVIIIAVAITLFFSKNIWESHKKRVFDIKRQVDIQKQTIGLAKDIGVLAKQVKQYNKLSWNTKESVEVMGSVNELAAKHGITIYAFDPGSLSDQGHFFTLPMTLNISAEYVDLVRFLSALETQSALTRVRMLSLTPQGKQEIDKAQARASLAIDAYIIK